MSPCEHCRVKSKCARLKGKECKCKYCRGNPISSLNDNMCEYKTWDDSSFNLRAKKHHFKSASILGRFSLNPKESLRNSKTFVLDKKEKRVTEQTADSIFKIRNLYSFTTYFRKTSPDFVEKKLLGKIDQEFSNVFSNLEKNQISSEDRIKVISYFMSVRFRNPFFLKNAQKMVEDDFSQNFGKKGLFKNKDQEKKGKELLGKVLINNYIMKLLLDVVLNDKTFFISHECYNMKVIENKTDIPFCIGDSSVLSLNENGVFFSIKTGGVSPFLETTYMVMPISYNKLLVLSSFNKIPDSIENPEIVKTMNSLQLIQSNNWFSMPQYMGKSVEDVEQNKDLSYSSKEDIKKLSTFFNNGQSLKNHLDVYPPCLEFSKIVIKAEAEEKLPSSYNLENKNFDKRQSEFKKQMDLFNEEYHVKAVIDAFDQKYNTKSKDELSDEDWTQLTKDLIIIDKK